MSVLVSLPRDTQMSDERIRVFMDGMNEIDADKCLKEFGSQLQKPPKGSAGARSRALRAGRRLL
jgi:hypothetical protein